MCALEDPSQAYPVACLGITDRPAGHFWLIDATPDLPTQLGRMATEYPDCSFAGIFLTHAHVGHYTGLIHLGSEALNATRIPVICSPKMAEFLMENLPWSGLVINGHIDLMVLDGDDPLRLTPRVTIRPVAVPHRDEYTDTLAYVVEGLARTLFYCPDIDSWSRWDHKVDQFFQGVDIALLDGTFYEPSEVPGRDLDLIPHPFVVDYPEIFTNVDTEIYLIHLNHTNPLLDQGPQREKLHEQGYRVGEVGQRWAL
jgi:pyrroloquinoline quinone biosynthesis protein B